MSERDIQNAIRLAVGSLPDVRLFRNNVGTLEDSRGVPVKFGLAPGSADLIGIVAPHGRFLSIECKKPKHRTNKRRAELQSNWARMVEAFGGVAGRDVQSVEDAMALVGRARKMRDCE